MNEDGNILYESTVFNVVVRKGRVFFKRTNNTGLVKIVPITSDGKFVLISQWREAIQKKTIEFPSGLAGDSSTNKNETLIEAAHRELLEETGIEAENMVKIHQGSISPNVSADIITTFVASNLTHKQTQDEGVIEVHFVDRKEVYDWLYDQRLKEFVVDEKVYAGIFLAEKFLEHKTEEKQKSDGLPQAE